MWTPGGYLRAATPGLPPALASAGAREPGALAFATPPAASFLPAVAPVDHLAPPQLYPSHAAAPPPPLVAPHLAALREAAAAAEELEGVVAACARAASGLAAAAVTGSSCANCSRDTAGDTSGGVVSHAGSFSRAVGAVAAPRRSSGAAPTTREAAALAVRLQGAAASLGALKASVITASDGLLHLDAELSARLSEAGADVARNEMTAAWVAKWRAREELWRSTAATMQARIAALEAAAAGSGNGGAASTTAAAAPAAAEAEALRKQNSELAAACEAAKADAAAAVQRLEERLARAEEERDRVSHMLLTAVYGSGGSTSLAPHDLLLSLARGGRLPLHAETAAVTVAAPAPPPQQQQPSAADSAAVKAWQDEARACREEVTVVRRAAERADEEAASLRAQLHAAKAAASAATAAAEAAQADAAAARRKRRATKEKLAARSADLEATQARLRELEGRLEGVLASLAEDSAAAATAAAAQGGTIVALYQELVGGVRAARDNARALRGARPTDAQSLASLQPQPAEVDVAAITASPSAAGAALQAALEELTDAFLELRAADVASFKSSRQEAAAAAASMEAEVKRLRAALSSALGAAVAEVGVRAAGGGSGGSSGAAAPPPTPAELQAHILEAELQIADLRSAVLVAEARARDAESRLAASVGGSGEDVTDGSSVRVALSPYRAAASAASASSPSASPAPSLLACAPATGLTPADVAAAVARARAEERESLLREISSSHRAVLGARDAAAREAVATAYAAASTAERECGRLREELTVLQREWGTQRSSWASAVAGLEAQLSDALVTTQRYRQGVGELLAAAGGGGGGSSAPSSPSSTPSSAASSSSNPWTELSALATAIGALQLAAATHRRAASEAAETVDSLRAQLAAAVAAASEERVAAVAEAAARAEALANLRASEERGKAVDAAVAATRAAGEAAAAAAVAAAVADAEALHADTVAALRGEWEADTAEQLRRLARAKDDATEVAVDEARAEERRGAQAAIAAAGARLAADLAAAETRIGQYRELARRELVRRRAVHAKLLDVQGNIRVHVRVKPTAEQLAAAAAAAAAAGGSGGALVPRPGSSSTVPSRRGSAALGGNVAASNELSGFLRASAAFRVGLEEEARAAGLPPDPATASTQPAEGGAARTPTLVRPAIDALSDGRLLLRAPIGATAGLLPAASPSTAASFGGTTSAGQGRSTRKQVIEYEYDEVHGPGASQEGVFEYVRPMCDRALDGASGVVLAYGQTGSGKTHSMVGPTNAPGLIVRAIRHLFLTAAERCVTRYGRSGGAETAGGSGAGLEDLDWQEATAAAGTTVAPDPDLFSFTVSVFEVYQDKVYDLLASSDADAGTAAAASSSSASFPAALARERDRIGQGGPEAAWLRGLKSPGGARGASAADVAAASFGEPLPLRDTPAGGVEILGLTRLSVGTLAAALAAVNRGALRRTSASHALNERSSRSHMVVRLRLDVPGVGAATGAGALAGRALATLDLVDLAGSERVLRTGAAGEALRDAAAINTSLSALGNVIAGLRRRDAHIPYRDSKLTHALRDSLNGHARVLLLCCVSAEEADVSETICSLNFAARCRATTLAGLVAGAGAEAAVAGGRAASAGAASRTASASRAGAAGLPTASPGPRARARVATTPLVIDDASPAATAAAAASHAAFLSEAAAAGLLAEDEGDEASPYAATAPLPSAPPAAAANSTARRLF